MWWIIPASNARLSRFIRISDRTVLCPNLSGYINTLWATVSQFLQVPAFSDSCLENHYTYRNNPLVFSTSVHGRHQTNQRRAEQYGNLHRAVWRRAHQSMHLQIALRNNTEDQGLWKQDLSSIRRIYRMSIQLPTAE